MLTFRKTYFVFAVILLFVELFIALYVRDSFIRPYFGDFLVVILIYCFVRSFLNISVQTTAIFTLIFAFIVELLQNFKIAEFTGNSGAGTVIGTSFSYIDLLMYAMGILLVLHIEWIINKRRSAKTKIIIQR